VREREKVFEDSQETFFKKFLERSPRQSLGNKPCRTARPLRMPSPSRLRVPPPPAGEAVKNPVRGWHREESARKFLKILKKLFSKSFLSGVRGRASEPNLAGLHRYFASQKTFCEVQAPRPCTPPIFLLRQKYWIKRRFKDSVLENPV